MALAGFWGRTFSVRPTDAAGMAPKLNFYRLYQGWDCTKMLAPSLEIIEFLASSLKSTASGIDGIPNTAWKHGGNGLASYITDLVGAFCGNRRLQAVTME